MPNRELTNLARRVEADWSPSRAANARRVVANRATRRRAASLVLGALCVVGVVGAFVAKERRAPHDVAIAQPTLIAVPAENVEATETTVTPVAPHTDFSRDADRAYVLRAGTARFVVKHDEAHPFTVRAGDVVVEDVGTVFTVAYVHDRVVVDVVSGSARVRHGGASSLLDAGGHIDVSAFDAPIPTAETNAVAHPSSTTPARDEVAPLLRAADDARAAGESASALEPLRRVVRDHASDPRAGLAAFTLGRILLDDLDRPSEAADAFATARARGGLMAEDALGREAIARARAGEADRAHDLAVEYLRLYPSGERAREVQRFAARAP